MSSSLILVLTTLLGCSSTPAEAPSAPPPSTPAPEAPSEPRPPKIDPDERLAEADNGKPHTILFVVMDTVRASSMSVCGYDKPTTPYLSNLVEQFGMAGTCEAYSPATWTLPSHTSYFTGLTPVEHGVDQFGLQLPDEIGPTLPEVLSKRGYQTAMFAANRALHKSGLARGFDHVRFAEDMRELRHPRFAGQLSTFLATLDPSQPLFLFVNLIDAHDPYPAVPAGLDWLPAQPEVFLNVGNEEADGRYHRFLRGEVADPSGYTQLIGNAYDYGVYLEDQNIKATVRALREAGRVPGPLRMVVTSDHGEFTGEHDLLRHNAYVWEPVVRVPLFVLDTRHGPPSFDGPVSAMEVHDLVLTGRRPAQAPPARSWSRLMPERPVKPGLDMTALWTPDQPKLLWKEGRVASVELTRDPAEADLKPATGHPALPAFREQVLAYRTHLEATAGKQGDAEALQELRELGYVE